MSPFERQLLLSSGELISVSSAAKRTPYSAEYLSLLARKGKLKAVKISRDWLTTRQAVFDYVKKQEAKHQKILNKFKQSALSGGGGAGFVPVSFGGGRVLAHHISENAFHSKRRII